MAKGNLIFTTTSLSQSTNLCSSQMKISYVHKLNVVLYIMLYHFIIPFISGHVCMHIATGGTETYNLLLNVVTHMICIHMHMEL